MEVRLIDAYNHRMCSAVQFTLNVYSTGGGGGWEWKKRRRKAGAYLHTRYARLTLADPTPRLCPDAVGSQCEWVPDADPELAVGASPGDHREVVGRSGAERVHYNATESCNR